MLLLGRPAWSVSLGYLDDSVHRPGIRSNRSRHQASARLLGQGADVLGFGLVPLTVWVGCLPASDAPGQVPNVEVVQPEHPISEVGALPGETMHDDPFTPIEFLETAPQLIEWNVYGSRNAAGRSLVGTPDID